MPERKTTLDDSIKFRNETVQHEAQSHSHDQFRVPRPKHNEVSSDWVVICEEMLECPWFGDR